jgi:ATP-dependent helicase HepA
MTDFVPGQRCISDAELQMGLGTILKVEQRTVTVHFMTTGEIRTYATHSAPLTRVSFSVGETIRDHTGLSIRITSIDEIHGLYQYSGVDSEGKVHTIREAELDNTLKLNKPVDRLFNGQIDKSNWFSLRYLTLHHRSRLQRSELQGLLGCRTSLIPHQLYIVHEVANRYAPRVLLADEVGLGKTIEAGLILHHQLLTERARRILIIVPETLVHQWLVEMLRRFNLHFRIFDADRCDALLEENDFSNIFDSEQLVLCSIDFLVSREDVFRHCVNAKWDLMVVDEAHHLQWSQDNPGPEYQVVEQLSLKTPGVLLLTATPEQLGKESHFARLRLLDIDRYPDYQSLIEEEQNYEPYARLIENLIDANPITDQDHQLLRSTFREGDNAELVNRLMQTDDETDTSEYRHQLIEHMLDRHGTGRVLFRNTRNAVKGFPQRQLHHYPLTLPEQYRQLLADSDKASRQKTLTPEILVDHEQSHWTQYDPRLQWLVKLCAEHQGQKILAITSQAQTALDIVNWIRTNSGIHAAAFHQGLSIVERDRAAAYFADTEAGCQLLVCSEIGSEGRNFQFAHHLVMFDLPDNPDLLEQRIGRLDRIGQTSTIHIHVPCFESSPQGVLFHWYHSGLDAFRHTCPAGQAVYKRVHEKLTACIYDQYQDKMLIDSLIETTAALNTELTQSLQRGRDRLLEYNSCRPKPAARLKSLAEQHDASSDIMPYMELVYDCFGIDSDVHSENCYVLHPTEQMVAHFPGLTDDGLTVTYNRETALSFEDAHYITWEHPMTLNAMDMVMTNEQGNTSVIATENLQSETPVKPGSILTECLFLLEASAKKSLNIERYLPSTMIRIVCDEKGAEQSRNISHHALNDAKIHVDKTTARKVIKAREKLIRAMITRSEKYAAMQSEKLLAHSHDRASKLLTEEINRLMALKIDNPNIRQEEIDFFQDQLDQLNEVIDTAHVRIDAIRVVVVT